MLPRSRYAKEMLTGAMRGFIIKHKGVFEKAIIAFAKILPELIRAKCKQPNTHVILDIGGRFFKYETNSSKRALYEAAFKILPAEYEHDPFERDLFDWFVEQLVIAYLDGSWQPREAGRPAAYWNEPVAERERIKQFLAKC